MVNDRAGVVLDRLRVGFDDERAVANAGLLLPAEEEALTVRATRDALAKLDANPERLFQ